MDHDIAGSIIATIAQLQRELQEDKDAQQQAIDHEIDANVHKWEAENEVPQLKRNLFGTEQATLEAQKTARKYDKLYHETLVKL